MTSANAFASPKAKMPRRISSALDYIERIRQDVEQEFTFFVAGTPVPQGSKNTTVVRRKNYAGPEGRKAYKSVMYEQEKNLKPWRSMIERVAKTQKPEDWDATGFFGTYAIFFFPRPEFHFDSERELKPKYSNHLYKKTAPDGDKCLRAVNDALTGILFSDDAAVIPGFGCTLYAEPYLPGALISIVKLRGKPDFRLTIP
jgi:Holliday junction resolvase RusA-like endonuclease